MKKVLVAVCCVVGAIAGAMPLVDAKLSSPKVAPLHSWKELKAPHQVWPYGGAIYYSFPVDGGSRAHLVVVDMRAGTKWQIRPAVAEPATAPTSEIAIRENASAAINGGYFNLKDGGASASYVMANCSLLADPRTNKLLTENPKLQPFLPQIFNRTEVRFFEDAKGNPRIQFAKHDAPCLAGLKLMHSLQGGPRLLPAIDAVEEAFVRKEPDGATYDAINTKKAAARTAFGVTADGYAMFLTVSGTGQDPESSGVSLTELADLMKTLGCVEALNLDGGASTTMYVRLGTPGQSRDMVPAGTVVCGKNPETRVKSALILIPKKLP